MSKGEKVTVRLTGPEWSADMVGQIFYTGEYDSDDGTWVRFVDHGLLFYAYVGESTEKMYADFAAKVILPDAAAEPSQSGSVASAEQIAQQVLDNHVIRDDWKRTGAQIRSLLVEAVLIERGEGRS